MAAAKRIRAGYAAKIRLRRKTDPEFRARRNAAVARWAAKTENKAKMFARYLKRAYGLSLEAYDAMLQRQDNRCGICGSSDSGVMTKNKANRWHVDHDHATGKVRGLLCGPCNTGLGGFRDSPVALRNAAVYVERNRVHI